MSPALQNILNALEKADSIPAKEMERLRKELDKTEKNLHKKDALLNSQARELEIEAAMEKVRSRTMGMQKSVELKDVIKVIFDQLARLGINAEHAGIVVDYEPKKAWHFWIAETQDIPAKVTVPYLDLVWDRQFTEAKKKGKDFFTTQLDFDEKNSFYKVLLPHIEGLTKKVRDFYFNCPGLAASTVIEKDIGLYIENFSGTPYSSEENDILKRFAKVFQQTYTRFLDLKKAEAQAREAQIEGALERVRTRTMAMHKSEELAETALVLYKQFSLLGNIPDRMSIGIFKEDTRKLELWPTDQLGSKLNKKFAGSWERSPIMIKIYKAWKAGDNSHVADLSGQDLKEWLKFIREEVKLFVDDSHIKGRRVQQAAFFSHGFLLFTTNEPIADEILHLLIRFAGVFSQTYTRFLDLQKAEAQARQAQIEAALERVRTRTMAMHNTEDIAATVTTFFNEIIGLGLGNTTRSGIGILSQSEKMELWTASVKDKSEVILQAGLLDMTIHPLLQGVKKAWQSGDPHFTYELSGKDKLTYFRAINKAPVYTMKIDLKKLPEIVYHYSFPFRDGSLFVFSDEPLWDDIQDIFKRFAAVFGQTYTRYLDLHTAEAQAREAQIENSLERIRARAMAMQSSEELHDVLYLLFQQFDVLGIQPISAFLSLFSQEERVLTYRATGTSGARTQGSQTVAIDSLEVWKELYDKWKTDTSEAVEVIYYPKEILPKLFELFEETFSSMPVDERMTSDHFPEGGYTMHGHTRFGYIGYNHIRLPTEEEKEILTKFATEFERVYQRFLDIEKAEAQAREAQIEAAIEKVRSQSLAMHTTSEMQQVANAVYDQLHELGVVMDAVGMSGVIEAKKDYDVWIGGAPMGKALRIPYNKDTKIQRDYNKAIKDRADLFARTYKGKVKEEYINHLLTHGEFPKALKKKMVTSTAFSTSIAFAKNSGIQIARYTDEPYTAEENELLKRFARVFEQAYIRFMDLQKAEVQTKEAQIEAALEKVRSRSMAMHGSSEMLEVIVVVSEQLQQLNLNFNWVSFAKNKQEGDFTFWLASRGQPKPILLEVPTLDSPVLKRVYEAQKKEITFLADVFTAEENREWHEHLIKYSDLKYFPEPVKDYILNAPGFARSCFLLKNIDLYVGTYSAIPFTEEENSIFNRFAQVFEQAYTRFLDLQKAETQAREAQIETALERVRSRAMGMHHTDELTEVLGVLFDQFDFLGINPVLTHLTLFDEANETFTLRITRGGKKSVIAEQLIDVNAVESWKTSFANWKKSELHALDCIDYPPEVLPAVWEVLDGVMTALPEGQKIYPEDFPNGLYTTQGHCKYGYIGFNHSRRATEEEKEIVVRFAKEFGRLYQRFLDIQKAESQAREAQIEGALERVRSKTMAMHNSKDLEDIVVSLFDEVLKLGLDKSIRCGIGILEGHEGMETRSVNSNSDGTVDLRVGMLNMTIHPMLVGLKKAWKNGRKGYSYEYTAKDVRKYYEALNNEPEYPFNADLNTLPKQEFHRSFFFSSGIIFAFSENPISEESSKIIARFAAVFGQTYRRFLDLQKAEERAKDAVKQASLDRVRGQIASMRSADDLGRITPLVFNELTTLGIPFIRCGVFIIDQPSEKVQVHLSAPDGHSLGVMLMPFDADPLTSNMVANWRKGEVFRAHWNREQFTAFMQTMVDLGQIRNKKVYQGAEKPPESLHLHFVPFTQGMLYVGSEATLTEEQIELVQSLADAFAIAYSRYEDFHKLEKAKERVETTLSELKATQNQLVQSEKMASLGELTAGIAHEIQNPLNFVNNFSEVSVELIEEMLEEMQNGDVEEVKALAEDIIQNLEKINHHGKRADGIVKGMLQHSRASSGEKEPTDINVLADEYLRLAYHGLRAKDKSFNATLETHFDDSIGKVNVLPQDMGRVILNLITNAFYVVQKKKEQQAEGYEPTVSVSTKKTTDGVEIRVKDNGNGIPEGIKEKIFQPFFTTKPTGQGTGLGLSMSYDIVTKGHGGSLEVNSEEGLGSEFIITLSV